MEFAPIKAASINAFSTWKGRNAPRLGAALAYYTLLSIAPLMVLLVAICGIVFKASAASDILDQTRDVIGPTAAGVLALIVSNAHQSGRGIGASVVALVTLLFGASGVFMELRSSLNEIWQVTPRGSSGWRGLVLERLVSFAMVLGLGVLMLASLLFTAAFAVVRNLATVYIPMLADTGAEVLNILFSTAALSLLFSFVFKFVPQAKTEWRHVLGGGLGTAILFMLGKTLLAVYLTRAAVGSTYGAAGSLIAFMVWVYYSAQIFLFGAAFTKVYSDTRSSSETASAAGK